MRLRRPDNSLLISVGLHVVLGVIAVKLLVFGYGAVMPPHTRIIPQQIGFLALPRQAGPPTEGKSGGDGRPEHAHAAPPPLSAPSVIPSGIAPPAPAAASGSGEVIGDGGPARGVKPSYSDPRVWERPDHIVSAPLTQSERLDSMLTSRIGAHNDTALASAGGRAPGDWTFQHGGKTYGIDSKMIHLGSVSIPTAVLALLPLNVQANPIEYERNRRLAQMRQDIMYQAQRGMNEAEFRDAVRQIRERKDRERDAQQQKQNGGGSTPPPVAASDSSAP